MKCYESYYIWLNVYQYNVIKVTLLDFFSIYVLLQNHSQTLIDKEIKNQYAYMKCEIHIFAMYYYH